MDEVAFTSYGDGRYMLHLGCRRHFVISDKMKMTIERIMTGHNEELKEILINKIEDKNGPAKSHISISDFQFRRAFISSRYMDIIARCFRALFEPRVMYILVPIILLGSICFYFISSPVVFTNHVVLDVTSLLLILVFFFHEIGHSSACRHFGGQVGDMGLGITSFIPALYADVSGAWALGYRERMIVNFGGIYFQNLFAFIVLIVSIAMQSQSLYIVGKLVFVSTVYQIIPFHRSDGYWILSDLLHQPNLHKHAQSLFLRKLHNVKIKITPKEWVLVFYYAIVTFLVLWTMIFIGYRLQENIILLPNMIWHNITALYQWRLDDLMLSMTDVWTIIYLLVFSKFIFSNIKIYISTKGAVGMDIKLAPVSTNNE